MPVIGGDNSEVSNNEASNNFPSTGRSSLTSTCKTEIIINVYDLLPPGKLSSFLWTLGSSILHTGLYIKSLNREYAFGGHNRRNMSGVYWTLPHSEPPGGTFRCEILQGISFQTEAELERIIGIESERYLGSSYNLLNNNCNHFTSHLCEILTGRKAPAWLNRAAKIGVAMPCVVPQEWLAPPDHETADGELVHDGSAVTQDGDIASLLSHNVNEDDEDERTSMLREDYKRAKQSFQAQQANAPGPFTDETHPRF